MSRLRTLDRYVTLSILKTGLVTSLIAAFMLMGVDLFSNLESYTSAELGLLKTTELTFLYFPEAFLLGIGPSFLFSVTYYLSMLNANNEIICIMNSGVSHRRILIPCVILAFFVSLFFFVFNEQVALPSSNQKNTLTKAYLNRGDTSDNTDIALNDVENGLLICANRYSDSEKALYGVTLFVRNSSGDLERRTQAFKATWSESTATWTFKEVTNYLVSNDQVVITQESEVQEPLMKLEPQLFRNLSAEISTMDLKLAQSYLKRMKTLDPVQYASLGTEYWQRVLSCLTPLVLMLIACSMNYRFKKNVLFFSLIFSICTAVVYYVIQMLTVMMADQGVFPPIWGELIPFISIIVLAFLFSLISRG